jgi:DNA-binding CsgD family transcriptional regulator
VNLAAARVRELFRLFAEAHELTHPGAVQQHLLEGFRRLLGGVGVLRLQVYDYAPSGGRDIRHGLDAGFDDDYRRRVRDQYLEESAVDPAVQQLLAHHADHCRDGVSVIRRRDVLADDGWYGSPFVAGLRRPARIDDGIYTGRLIGERRGDGVGVFRAWGDPPFTEEDRELTRLFHGEVLSRFALPDHGIGVVRLSPREQQTLTALLRGQRRKQIAADMGLTVNTVNEYVRSLYRRLGVSGLPELYRLYARRT